MVKRGISISYDLGLPAESHLYGLLAVYLPTVQICPELIENWLKDMWCGIVIYYCKVELPKTDSRIRTIPMLDEVYDVLKVEYERQTKAGFNSLEIDGMTGFIFCNKNGEICRPPSINYTINKIIELDNETETSIAGEEAREPLIIPNFTCHHMRHTFCTRICESETNVKLIQDVVGYASIETTMNIYAEVTKEKESI